MIDEEWAHLCHLKFNSPNALTVGYGQVGRERRVSNDGRVRIPVLMRCELTVDKSGDVRSTVRRIVKQELRTTSSCRHVLQPEGFHESPASAWVIFVAQTNRYLLTGSSVPRMDCVRA